MWGLIPAGREEDTGPERKGTDSSATVMLPALPAVVVGLNPPTIIVLSDAALTTTFGLTVTMSATCVSVAVTD